MDAKGTGQLVRHVLGAEPVRVEPMTFTHSGNTIFSVALDDGREVIVRMRGPDEDTFAHTERHLRTLTDLGLPAPRLLAADVTRTRFPFAYLILEKLPGRDLYYELPSMTRAGMSELAARIIEYQRRVATLPEGKGYGWGAIGEGGPEPSWLFCLTPGSTPPVVDPASPGGDFRRRLFDAQVRLQPYFHTVRPTCFLEDLTTKNVLLENGELTGLIDFDSVCFGDPLWQIGLAAGCVLNDVGEEFLFYTEELCRIRGICGERTAAVTFYAAERATEFLEIARDAGDTPTAERLVPVIDRWLKTLEQAA
ncbi:MAG: aminoglycoside phosphotransferase family protein [Capsulimonadales bacterium]|nr:aminoglycoside phosphotransferase family protein [Capsulimonadales bacterium]